MNRAELIEKIYQLTLRIGGMCIGEDLSAMSINDLWGLYWYLRRLVSE